MASYSIKDLEKLSGIKAHTLRIWEKRHGLLEPKRTDTNIRSYDDDQLKKILTVSILNEQGLKISKIASMSRQELEDNVRDISSHSRSTKYYVEQLIMSMVDLDEGKFQNIIHEVSMKLGFEDLVTQVLYAFLDQIGVLWLTGNIIPSQEHFVSNLIRQKISVAIDNLPQVSDPKAESMVLFLPEKELHEIGLLLYYYLTKKAGYKVIYLGQCVPAADMIQTLDDISPDYLVSSITTPQFKDGGVRFFTECSEHPALKKIIVSGPGIGSKVTAIPKVLSFKKADEFKQILLGLPKSV